MADPIADLLADYEEMKALIAEEGYWAPELSAEYDPPAVQGPYDFGPDNVSPEGMKPIKPRGEYAMVPHEPGKLPPRTVWSRSSTGFQVDDPGTHTQPIYKGGGEAPMHTTPGAYMRAKPVTRTPEGTRYVPQHFDTRSGELVTADEWRDVTEEEYSHGYRQPTSPYDVDGSPGLRNVPPDQVEWPHSPGPLKSYTARGADPEYSVHAQHNPEGIPVPKKRWAHGSGMGGGDGQGRNRMRRRQGSGGGHGWGTSYGTQYGRSVDAPTEMGRNKQAAKSAWNKQQAGPMVDDQVNETAGQIRADAEKTQQISDSVDRILGNLGVKAADIKGGLRRLFGAEE